MSYTSYRQMEQAISAKDSFTGNSAKADWGSDVYCVYSYTTLIASYDRRTGEVWLNPRKYSVTTSRLQNIIKRAWGLN